MNYIMGLSGADGLTHVNIASVYGVVLQSFTVGAINLFFASEKEVQHNLAEAFVTAQMAGYPVQSCIQVCAGVAGLHAREGSLQLFNTLRDVMWRCGYKGDALLLGDEQIALAGALGGARGIILLAGNASACFGQNTAGASHRTGGMGHLADDDGSAYAIGREILRAAARAGDGRGPLTQLTAAIYRKFGLGGAADFARCLRSAAPGTQQICELAACLPTACQARDKVAMDIVEKTVAQLAALVVPVVEKLHMQNGVLAVAGKVLLNDAFIGIAFKRKIAESYPQLQCIPPRSDGTAGAVLLAKERLALRGYARG